MGDYPYMEILKFYLAPLKESRKNAKNRKLSKKQNYLCADHRI